MAITAPTEFSHSTGYTYLGGTVDFTWNKGTGDIEWYVILMRNQMDTSKEQKYYFLPSETSAAITMPSSASNIPNENPNVVDNFTFNLAAGRGNKDNPSEYSECNITCVVYIRKDIAETPTPPMTATGGRLEQFQNSAGEQIYPRTIIEGIIRQSDSKPLSELLSGIELPLSIADGGTGADEAKTALANLIDNADDTYPSGNPYSSIYIPVSVNGVCHKVPITAIQKWTVGDRQSSVSQENTDYGSFIARGIAAGTTDYVAGSTPMTNGTICLVYE